MMSTFLQDLRYACRILLKAPAFAVVAIATLAIGIGLNTAMFSVVHTVLIRPLPFQNPERIVSLSDANPKTGVLGGAVSPPNFLDWQAQNRSLSAMSAYNVGTVTLTGSGNPRQIDFVQATPQLFNVLGANAIIGRGFAPEEGERGRDHVAVLSHRLWKQSFGGDAGIVGKTIELDGEKYNVIGVMPQQFQFPLSGTDAWVPLSFPADVSGQRGAHYLSVIGRLKDGVSLQQAQADLKQIAAQLEKQYPKTNIDSSVAVVSYREAIVGNVRASLLLLLGAVAFVVLIACVNVANLLLARSAARERELAIRTALGAGRARLIRQLLTESALISVIGAGTGLAVATWLQSAIVQFGPKNVPLLDHIGLSAPVLAFTAGLSLLTAFLFGLMPAMRAAASDLHVAMRSGSMGAIGGKHHRSMRNSLVVAELALSMLLLVGAGLLIRSFQRLSGIDPGFKAENVLTFSLGLPEIRYKTTAQVDQFFDQVMTRVRALPGVQSAGSANFLPLGGFKFSSSMYIDNAADDPNSAQLRVASEGYFETMQIPLVRGRLIGKQDQFGTQKVLLISESAAKNIFPGADPIGHHVRFGARPGGERLEGDIVGVVGDVHDFSLAAAPPPMFYAALPQSGVPFEYFVVRTNGNPEAMMNSIAEQVREVDPNVPLADVIPMEGLLSTSVAERRFYMFLLGMFASVALVLSVVGIYGVISYSVTQRTREIGLRVALGARSSDIVRMVIGEAMAMVAIGVTVGIISATLLTRFLKSLLFGIGTHDPATLLIVSITLVSFALFASYWPARRAMQVEPMVALRSE
jgi:putative ABC transport system permease protein